MNKSLSTFAVSGALMLFSISPALCADENAASANTPNAPVPEKIKERILAKFDANHNGVLDPDEKAAAQQFRKERREKMLARFDKNGDGQLDADELAAAKAARQERQEHRKAKSGAQPAATPTQQ